MINSAKHFYSNNLRTILVFLIPVVALGFFLTFSPRSTINSRVNPYGEIITYNDKFGELKTEIIKEGAGDESLKTGDIASVNYIGWLSENGKVFDQSSNSYNFQLGQGVIEGWSQGTIGMKRGEIRRVLIPSSLGYKEAGSGEIPPNADLVFVIELVDFTAGTTE